MKLRTREHGTDEYLCKDVESVVSAAQDVLDSHSYAVVNEQMLDAVTANLIVSVWGGLNETNRTFLKKSFGEWCEKRGAEAALKILVSICWKATK